MNSDINRQLNEIVESLKVYSELERLSGIEFSVRSAAKTGAKPLPPGGASKEKELALLEKDKRGGEKSRHPPQHTLQLEA